MSQSIDFENLVEDYYGALYRFALSLARHESDARDLTQQTFLIWAKKGHQLENQNKVKSWLFTTMYRCFLQNRRRVERFPQVELPSEDCELVMLPPAQARKVDANTLLERLQQLDPMFRAPLAMFYLENFSYIEISEVLEIPLGTVKSRISRAIQQLQKLMGTQAEAPSRIRKKT